MRIRRLTPYERAAAKVYKALSRSKLREKEIIWMLAEVIENCGKALTKEPLPLEDIVAKRQRGEERLTPGEILIVVADEIRAMVEIYFE